MLQDSVCKRSSAEQEYHPFGISCKPASGYDMEGNSIGISHTVNIMCRDML